MSGNGDAMLLTVSVSISPVSHAPPSRQAKCQGFKPRLFDSYNPQLSNDVPNNTIVIASRDVLALNIRTTDPQQAKKASKESVRILRKSQKSLHQNIRIWLYLLCPSVNSVNRDDIFRMFYVSHSIIRNGGLLKDLRRRTAGYFSDDLVLSHI